MLLIVRFATILSSIIFLSPYLYLQTYYQHTDTSIRIPWVRAFLGALEHLIPDGFKLYDLLLSISLATGMLSLSGCHRWIPLVKAVLISL